MKLQKGSVDFILLYQIKPETLSQSFENWNDPLHMPSAALLATGLELIWQNRKIKKVTAVFDMRSELELAVSIRRRSRSRHIRESADIMQNMITIFCLLIVAVHN